MQSCPHDSIFLGHLVIISKKTDARIVSKLILKVALVNLLLIMVMRVVGTFLDTGQLIYEGRWRGDIDIFIVDITRGLTQNITRNRAMDTRPVWSPDGRHIAFESTRHNEVKIFVMNALGQEVRPILPDWDYPRYQNNPQWSGDGRTVFFRSYFSLNAPTFRINLDGSNFGRVTPGEITTLVRTDFNPDRSLVMSYRKGVWGIYLYSRDWSELKQLTNNNIRFRDMPRWSPDMEQVAFISSDIGETEIYVMNADGGNLRRITADGLIKTNLNWRP